MRRGPIGIFDETPRRQASLASWYAGSLGRHGRPFVDVRQQRIPVARAASIREGVQRSAGVRDRARQRIQQLEQFIHPSIGRARAQVARRQRRAGARLRSRAGPAAVGGPAEPRVDRVSRWSCSASSPRSSRSQQGDGVAHGVLTPDRIVVTPEGNLVIIEHVLGPAVESLDLSPARMSSEPGWRFRRRSPDVERPRRRRAARLDCALAHPRPAGGRSRLSPQRGHAHGRLPKSRRTGLVIVVAALRMWLEQALQLGARTFGSAEARMRRWPDCPTTSRRGPTAPHALFPSHRAATIHRGGPSQRASVASTR